MTQMTTTKAGPNLGARVEGLDLRAMTPEEVREILVPLLHEYHVLVIPGEVLEADELEQFARAWGDLLEHPASRVEETPYVQIIFSEGEGDDRLGQWHSDMTWHETPPIITMLQAHVLPSEGGGTIFANQHLAYETLPEELRSQLDGAKAWNSGKAFGPNMPDTLQPAIRTHDETGRKALYINPVFTTEIDGLDQTTSRELILRAVQHGTRPEFTYRHRWEIGDLVLWDNRSVMHYPIRDYSERRALLRAVVAGGVPV